MLRPINADIIAPLLSLAFQFRLRSCTRLSRGWRNPCKGNYDMFAQRQGEAITMTAFTDAITLSGIGAGIDKDSI